MEPEVIFEDASLLVINKPAGIIVNKSDTTRNEITIQDWAEKKFTSFLHSKSLQTEQNLDSILASDFYTRGGIVHRLDKETSGILLIAKTPAAFVFLQSQFKERLVEKTYLALVHGKIALNNGEINVPVGRLPWNRKQFGIVAGGREAVTKYIGIKHYQSEINHEQLTLVELHPQSGRTHQIRVHMKYLGHPVFADFLYAGRKIQAEDRKYLSRVFLHAAKISFNHPVTKQTISFTASLPDELTGFIDKYLHEEVL